MKIIITLAFSLAVLYLLIFLVKNISKNRLIFKATIKSLFKSRVIIALIFTFYIVIFGFIGAYNVSNYKVEQSVDYLLLDYNIGHSALKTNVENYDITSDSNNKVIEKNWINLTDQSESLSPEIPQTYSYNTLLDYVSNNEMYGEENWWIDSTHSGQNYFDNLNGYIHYIVIKNALELKSASEWLNEYFPTKYVDEDFTISSNFNSSFVISSPSSYQLNTSVRFTSINNYNPLDGNEFRTEEEYYESIKNGTNGAIITDNETIVNDNYFVQEDALSNLFSENADANGTINNPYYVIALNDITKFYPNLEIGLDANPFTIPGTSLYFQVVGTFYSPAYTYPYQISDTPLINLEYTSVFLMNTTSHTSMYEFIFDEFGRPEISSNSHKNIMFTFGYDDIYEEVTSYKDYAQFNEESYYKEITERTLDIFSIITTEFEGLYINHQHYQIGSISNYELANYLTISSSIIIDKAYNTDRLMSILTIVFVIIFFILLTIFLNRRLNNQYKFVGSLKTYGYSGKEVVPIFLMYPFILIGFAFIISTIIVFPLGIVLSNAFVGVQFSIPLYISSILSFNLFYYMIILPILLGFVFCLVKILKISFYSPMKLNSGEVMTKPNYMVRKLNKFKIRNFTTSYIYKNLFRNISKVFFIFTTFLICTFLIMLSFSTINFSKSIYDSATTLSTNANSIAEVNERHDIEYRNLVDTNGDDIDEILEVYDLGLNNTTGVYYDNLDLLTETREGTLVGEEITNTIIDYLDSAENSKSIFNKETSEFESYIPFETFYTIFKYSLYIVLDDIENGNTDFSQTINYLDTELESNSQIPWSNDDLEMGVLVRYSTLTVFQQVYYSYQLELDDIYNFNLNKLLESLINGLEFEEIVKVYLSENNIKLIDTTFNDIYYDSNQEIPLYFGQGIIPFEGDAKENSSYYMFAFRTLDEAKDATTISSKKLEKVFEYEGEYIPVLASESFLFAIEESPYNTNNKKFTIGDVIEVPDDIVFSYPGMELQIVAIDDENVSPGLLFDFNTTREINKEFSDERLELVNFIILDNGDDVYVPTNSFYFSEAAIDNVLTTSNELSMIDISKDASGAFITAIDPFTISIEVFTQQVDMVYESLRNVLIFFTLIAIFISIFIIFFISREINENSVSEVALLKSLGYTETESALYTIFPYSIISVIASAVAIALSLLLLNVLTNIIIGTGIYLILSVTPVQIIVILSILIFVIFVIYLLAVRFFSKVNIIKVIGDK